LVHYSPPNQTTKPESTALICSLSNKYTNYVASVAIALLEVVAEIGLRAGATGSATAVG
jgi:hypothetical protein